LPASALRNRFHLHRRVRFGALLKEGPELAASTSKKRSAAKKERRPKRKICNFCADKITEINYKDVTRLRKYISERGKILPRRISGSCAKHQRLLTVAVKRARVIAFLPFVSE
jgi:small subunit ribosomal protein S18